MGSTPCSRFSFNDYAKLAIEQGASEQNVIIDAIGPETFTYRELVETIWRLMDKPWTMRDRQRMIISVSPGVGYAMAWVLGKLLGDIMVTRDEIEGMMQDLLVTNSPPVGETPLSEWVAAHSGTVGRRYASELARRKDRKRPYVP